MRFGEDIDFSIRIFKADKLCRLFPEAWVWHKRRTDFHKFWKQVYNSGIARINLYKKYPESLKLVHLLPMVFTVGITILLLIILAGLLMLCCPTLNILGNILITIGILPILLYAFLICLDSTRQNNSLKIGILSIQAAFIQLTGYGCGFINAWWKRCVRGMDEFAAYEKNFYK